MILGWNITLPTSRPALPAVMYLETVCIGDLNTKMSALKTIGLWFMADGVTGGELDAYARLQLGISALWLTDS